MKRTACIVSIWIAAAVAAQAGNLGGYWAWWRTSDAGEGDGFGFKLTLTEDGSSSALELRGTLFNDLSRDEDSETLKVTPIELGVRFPVAEDGPLEVYMALGGGYYMVDYGNRSARDEFGYYGLLGVEVKLGTSFVLFGEAAYRRLTIKPGNGNLALHGIGANAGLAYTW